MFLGDEYQKILKEEPGTYFLTTHLAENFDELCVVGLGLDRHPKLKKLMFSHYKKAVFIDTRSEGVAQAVRNAASYLGLPLEYAHPGVERIRDTLVTAGIGRHNKMIFTDKKLMRTA